MTEDASFCNAQLPDWGLSCWGPVDHRGVHHGGNFTTRRMGTWGVGVPTHVDRMPPRDREPA